MEPCPIAILEELRQNYTSELHAQLKTFHEEGFFDEAAKLSAITVVL